MTTVNINNNDILEKVNSINLLSHLNDVEEFNNRNDLQELKTNLNIKDLLANNLSELKEKIGNVEEFTNDNDPKIKLLKDLFSNSSVAAPLPPVTAAVASVTASQPPSPPVTASEPPSPPVTASEPPPPPANEQNLTTSIVVEDKVEKELTPKPTLEQTNEIKRINQNLDVSDKIDINNKFYPKTPPKSGLIRWGDNPIWMGKIYKNELDRKFGDGKHESANVFMKNDGYMVVDYTPRNPGVTLIGTGENADIKKDKDGKYVLLKKIKLDEQGNPVYENIGDNGDQGVGGYGFEFVYKGAVNTFLSLFGNEKSGGKKKSKSKRTKKNGSLKKRK